MTRTSSDKLAVPPQRPDARLSALVRRNFGTARGLVRTLLGEVEYVLGRLDDFCQPVTAQRLVFVCLGNINRSAFAEAVAQQQAWSTCSLGLSTTDGQGATPQAIATAQQLGLDLRAHRATDISNYSFREGDVLFVMEIRHVERLLELGIPRHAIRLLGAWSHPQRIHLHDPHTLSDEYFLSCFTLIRSAVLKLVAQLPPPGPRHE